LNLHEKLYLKDNDTPLNVEYKIVNKDDIKPTFTLSKTQFRSQKQEDLIKKIKENFNPDLLVNIRGDLKKGNPIITGEGEVISGNHRAAALKELEGENLAKYQNAVKEAFGVELKENEMLVRVADTSEAEIRRFSAASNEGLENNLGEQGVSLFAKYQDKIKALKEAKKPFVADDVYNLKYLVNKALGESSITKENDTSKALFASLARGRNNTILKALNELEKENLEQVSKVANMFFDNAGAFYNLTHDLDLPKMQNLQNYFSDVLVSAAKADFTRAEDFARLNEDIRAFLDSGDKNAMLKLSPNLVSDLLAKAMGAGFARFARLENPSASLYEFLNGLKAELIEKGMPDLFSGGKGIKLNERDEFDFAKELILKGQDSEEKFRLYQNLEELKAWRNESEKQSVKDERVELKEALRGVLNQDIINESTGLKARIGIRELNKISSQKAITKSLDNGFSREEHFEASKHLDTLFKKAILREKHKDSKGRENIEAVYRFESPYKNANAKITVLEKIEGNNKIYTLELENLEPVSLNANALSKETEALTQSVESGHKQSTTIAKTDEQSIAQKAKNDEVLEAEVIEEVDLNEPMKFLEFQQRKLLTYIKENTPLKLLEHKKELKTRDILNFLEQSALNGKQKVFLMRNLERDLGKIELKIKENESVKAKIKNTYEISQSEAKELGEHFNFKGKKPLLRELRENEIKHALKSHGNKESEEARGNIAITLQDIEANYPKITQEFDEKFFTQKGVIYVKQVNGHHIVIEEALSGQDKLIFKTMWKTKGNYNKEVLLKNAKTSPYPQNADEAVRLETISKQELEQSNPQQSHLSTNESIAQNSQEAKIKEAVKNHNAIYKEILDNDYIFTDERSKIFRKRERELIENLAKDEKVQAFTSQWGYPFKKDGELHGIGLDYKAKVYGKGKHKMMRVSGGGFGSATQQKKQERLLELEKERLQEAFKADFGIDGFISKYVENDFFRTLWHETSNYKGTDYGWGVQPREYYPYYENRIMPSDTITQAKEKLQKEKSSWSVKRQEAKGSEDIIFTDKKGKEHTLTKETQKAWLEAFNLKSLEDSYIPNHNEAIKQALEGKEIKLQLGSLKKLVAQGREKYIPQIKEVLDRPEAIMRDDMGEYLFIKHLKDDDYFVNVSFDNGEYLVSISNGIKETRNLNNKLKKGGEFIYQSPNFNFISQKLLQTSQYSANKIDEDIIAQNAKSERAEFESFKDK
ncbi:hypothetical protein R1539_001794, partial [Campylobacter upsaliensis]|nr:hypothetical protein [Campylobacter upsaliensis]